jgi:hypothetical protein
VNHRSTWLPHGLNRSGNVLGSDGSALINGSTDGGGVARDSVDEVGSVVVVRDASGP